MELRLFSLRDFHFQFHKVVIFASKVIQTRIFVEHDETNKSHNEIIFVSSLVYKYKTSIITLFENTFTVLLFGIVAGKKLSYDKVSRFYKGPV